ncbi:precorrin-6y C5,15-methyltransferase (decarboxylating) subunit CbiE [Parasulfitobacter algicola]|uniref:Precorrin-6y C5,15-methyltransferase (Decarboxylating) subunit CbiE n=1 Tax=Parasulfitobacter algicola TaxID=2614809 RepID=A0ABX2J0Y7_9RHOB|nr:precorrin-6y C5,15-methyltransferase (decarboxylating) subunit CbiE [Sulfitobacter algicola]NSX56833.1 precorrin-6y C5,15-methyltransferase (decarboxylating) subunit CbiE [Sulfitobacter algicola]
MSDMPWLTLIGLGEDGPEGLSPASQAALSEADVIMGPPRHLNLLPDDGKTRRISWPVPFADGIPELMKLRGRPVAVLASGDPFWFGAGSVITRDLGVHEWRAFPGTSSFSLTAARMGWPLEHTTCLGLHAAPLSRLRPHLAPEARLIVLLRDGQAIHDLGAYLTDQGFGDSTLTVFEALEGPWENRTDTRADAATEHAFSHPVCVALTVMGQGKALPRTSGLPDDFFDHDGQITKTPMRAVTLSTLAPCKYERLWDIGSGSGSIAIEWLLSDPTTEAIAIETRPDRTKRIKANADTLGVDGLRVITGTAPEALGDLPAPDAVFIGGGLSEALLNHLQETLCTGTRLVANAVTLEAEALLTHWQVKLGGTLLRVELSRARPLGAKRGWQAAYPVIQWSVTL